jgi:hypothetical protein
MFGLSQIGSLAIGQLPTASTSVALAGTITAKAKANAALSVNTALTGTIKAQAEDRAGLSPATALSATDTTQAKANIRILPTAILSGRIHTQVTGPSPLTVIPGGGGGRQKPRGGQDYQLGYPSAGKKKPRVKPIWLQVIEATKAKQEAAARPKPVPKRPPPEWLEQEPPGEVASPTDLSHLAPANTADIQAQIQDAMDIQDIMKVLDGMHRQNDDDSDVEDIMNILMQIDGNS